MICVNLPLSRARISPVRFLTLSTCTGIGSLATYLSRFLPRKSVCEEGMRGGCARRV